MKQLSIIIPVYNEKNTIHEVLTRVFATQLPGWKKEVIVIDDGSRDGTIQVLEKWKSKIQLIRSDVNQGKGASLKKGLSVAKGDVFLIQDADLEYSPSDYLALLAPFDHEQVHVVYGSRFLGAHLSTMYLYALGNKFVTFITNILYNTNITDMETGYKVFRKKAAQSLQLTSKRFDVEPEITATLLKQGYQIYEVPITYFGRKFSEGKKLTWRDGVMAVWTLIKHRLY